jgi:hypothetical protein
MMPDAKQHSIQRGNEWRMELGTWLEWYQGVYLFSQKENSHSKWIVRWHSVYSGLLSFYLSNSLKQKSQISFWEGREKVIDKWLESASRQLKKAIYLG